MTDAEETSCPIGFPFRQDDGVAVEGVVPDDTELRLRLPYRTPVEHHPGAVPVPVVSLSFVAVIVEKSTTHLHGPLGFLGESDAGKLPSVQGEQGPLFCGLADPEGFSCCQGSKGLRLLGTLKVVRYGGGEPEGIDQLRTLELPDGDGQILGGPEGFAPPTTVSSPGEAEPDLLLRRYRSAFLNGAEGGVDQIEGITGRASGTKNSTAASLRPAARNAIPIPAGSPSKNRSPSAHFTARKEARLAEAGV